MKRAAIGVRVHSGWGALVAMSGKAGAEEVIERRRIEIIDPKIAGGVQPYHYAENMEIAGAERHLAKCGAASGRLSVEAIGKVLRELRARNYEVVGCCILLSSGRPLPELAQILASHPLIHTAEGEFFRRCFRDAFESLSIPVRGIRERELADHLDKTFGKAASKLQERIAGMGRIVGPPWTADQKVAALGALIVLNGSQAGAEASH